MTDALTTEYFDISCGDDLDPFARDADPIETLAQDIYHLLITDKGSLLQDSDWGFGINAYISSPLPSTLAGDIENAVREDDRVSDARCTITPLTDQYGSYLMNLQVECDATFLNLAFTLTPKGFERVS